MSAAKTENILAERTPVAFDSPEGVQAHILADKDNSINAAQGTPVPSGPVTELVHDGKPAAKDKSHTIVVDVRGGDYSPTIDDEREEDGDKDEDDTNGDAYHDDASSSDDTGSGYEASDRSAHPPKKLKVSPGVIGKTIKGKHKSRSSSIGKKKLGPRSVKNDRENFAKPRVKEEQSDSDFDNIKAKSARNGDRVRSEDIKAFRGTSADIKPSQSSSSDGNQIGKRLYWTAGQKYAMAMMIAEKGRFCAAYDKIAMSGSSRPASSVAEKKVAY